jgi:membrane-associated phospholipid phosphatase
MPASTSFPSGHSAAAFAFATGVGSVLPPAAIPLRGLGALVAYSRVHTAVHYPADVVAGALLGTVIAQLTTHALDRRTAATFAVLLKQTGITRNAQRSGLRARQAVDLDAGEERDDDLADDP